MLLWPECLAAIQGFSVSCFCWEEELIESCRVFVQSYLFTRSVCQVSLPPAPPSKKKKARGSCFAEKSKCTRSSLLYFFPKSVFCISGFFLAFSLTPLLPELQKSNRNPFIPCSLAALSHCCNDQCLWQELQLSQFPLPPGTFCVPSI